MSELEALRECVDRVSNIAGCGDNSCRFKKPTGMATNGGCRCINRNGDAIPGLTGALVNLYLAAKLVVTTNMQELEVAKRHDAELAKRLGLKWEP